MGFWGIEVKPGRPHPYHSDNVEGSLYVTQATLGLGSSSERCILQCSVGHKNPIYLCSFLPDKTESCSLNLEFKDELVAFSVIGERSIHLSGYFLSDEGDHLRDEYDSDSGDGMSTGSEDSSEFEYVDAFTDDDDDEDDFEMFSPSPVPNSGVVIEEIVDDEKPTQENDKAKGSKKKNSQPSKNEDQNNSQKHIVKRGTGGSVLESEDEDGFPIASSQKNKAAIEESQAEEEIEKNKKTKQTKKRQGAQSDDATGKKKKVKSAEEGQQIKKKKETLKGNSEKVSTGGGDDNENDLNNDGIQKEGVKESQNGNKQNSGLVTDAKKEPGESASDKKKKKKKKKNKKNQDNGEDLSKNKTVPAGADESKSPVGSEDEPSGTKSSQVRTFPNGLVIEEIAMGKPDGKKASPGSQVSVRYTGKLQNNGKIFDSNVGRAPFKFRLGVGQVIKGWDVGVNGMRVGDKRRLTIPPAMGYGATGAGGKIPPNAWLVFEVELVNVK